MPSHHSACGDAVLLRIVHLAKARRQHSVTIVRGIAHDANKSQGIANRALSESRPSPKKIEGVAMSQRGPRPPAPTEESPGHYRAQGVAAPRRYRARSVAERGALLRRWRCRVLTLPRPERCCAPTLPSHTPNVIEPGTLPHPDAARPIRPIRRIRCRVQYDPTSQGRRIPEHCELQALPWRRPQPCRAISRAR